MRSYQFELLCFGEKDGKLGTFESLCIPGFQVNRIFYIFDVPKGETRADHACMNSSIVFIAMVGSVRISVETDGVITEYFLDNKSFAVYAPERSWIKAYDFSNDAVLLGLSDRRYADCQYEDDYDRYKKLQGD